MLSLFALPGSYAQEISPAEDKAPPLKLVQKITMPNVRGRIDRLAIDLDGQRLFAAAADNNSIEVIGLKEGKCLHRMTNIWEPQGVIYIPWYNWLVVTSGWDGTCNFYDGNTFNLIRTLNFDQAADSLYYEESSGYVYVGYG
jgi:hypothetical protein